VKAHPNNQVFSPLANCPQLMEMSRRLEGELFQTVGAADRAKAVTAKCLRFRSENNEATMVQFWNYLNRRTDRRKIHWTCTTNTTESHCMNTHRHVHTVSMNAHRNVLNVIKCYQYKMNLVCDLLLD